MKGFSLKADIEMFEKQQKLLSLKGEKVVIIRPEASLKCL